MITLNPFAISGLFIVAVYSPLFFYIYSKGKTKLTRIYSYHLLSILLWGTGCFLVSTTKDPNKALFFWKYSYICVLLIPVFFYHSVYLLNKAKNKIGLVFVYSQLIFFILVLLNNKMFIEPRYVYNQFYVFINSFYYSLSFIIWEVIVILGNLDLIKITKSCSGNEKKALYLLIFTGIGFIGGTNNFLTGLNIDIYPYGNFLIPIHSFGVSYAIFRHRLFNLEVVIKKSIVYSILLALITLLYLLLVISIERTIQYYYGYTSIIISFIIILLIGSISIPLKNGIQKIIDCIFFQKPSIEIIDENELLRQEIVQTDRLKSIATFASGMAHEIKNPLTSIKIFCEYLPKKIHDQAFLDKFIPIVSKDADRINELVHDLLDYAKPSPPEPRPTDIHKLIEGIIEALSTNIVAHKITIIRDYDLENIPPIPLDAKQIKQALLNIFLNATESMLTSGSILISTRLSSNNEQLIIKITDTGCGISAEDLPRIFDPFFTKKEKGTGLGLSITHGIIKEHRGKIFADSTVGRGTTFRIELPTHL